MHDIYGHCTIHCLVHTIAKISHRVLYRDREYFIDKNNYHGSVTDMNDVIAFRITAKFTFSGLKITSQCATFLYQNSRRAKARFLQELLWHKCTTEALFFSIETRKKMTKTYLLTHGIKHLLLSIILLFCPTPRQIMRLN